MRINAPVGTFAHAFGETHGYGIICMADGHVTASSPANRLTDFVRILRTNNYRVSIIGQQITISNKVDFLL